MCLNPDHFRPLICSVLSKAEHFHSGVYSPAAVELLMGTCAVESDFGKNIYQLGGGPGRGFFQMEMATQVWLWSYMKKYPGLMDAVVQISMVPMASEFAMETNIAYMILMARIRYHPYPQPLPDVDDINGLASYHKFAYNTVAGKTRLVDFVDKYNKYCV